MSTLPTYIIYILSFLCALIINMVAIPQLMRLSEKRGFYDLPDNTRKLHSNTISYLGGAGIFLAYIITSVLFMKPSGFNNWNYILAASILFFITGLIDDMTVMGPSKKILLQLLPALFTAYFAGIRLGSLYGLFGIGELPLSVSIVISVLLYLFIINAFNFIDGIDGLAGSIGTFSSLILGILLAISRYDNMTILAFALAGALAGFLRYNLHPAKIFMGDSGSLPVGYTVTMLSIFFISSINGSSQGIIKTEAGALIFTTALLSILLFDSLRVFAARMSKGISPFKGDRNHIHHYLGDIGLSNNQIILVILGVNILILAVSTLLQQVNINIAIAVIAALTMGFFGIVYRIRQKK